MSAFCYTSGTKVTDGWLPGFFPYVRSLKWLTADSRIPGDWWGSFSFKAKGVQLQSPPNLTASPFVSSSIAFQAPGAQPSAFQQ